MAVSGHNGDNETLVGFSSQIGLSFHDFETIDEIKVTQSKSPIDIIIPRDKSILNSPYQYVNAKDFVFSKESFFLQNTFNITTINASIHIDLKSFNASYLLVLKLGYMPIINSTYADYTTYEFICSSI